MKKKQRILEFVRDKGEASYSEIVLFIVKMNNAVYPNYKPRFQDVRGQNAGGFSAGSLKSKPYLLLGTSRLCKMPNGKYKAFFDVPDNSALYDECKREKGWRQTINKSLLTLPAGE